MRLLFKGGTVITGKGPRRADILVEGEKILDVCRDIPAIGAQVVDVSGMLLFPGFIDAHTHFDLDVCNTTTADDFASGSRAALRQADFRTIYYTKKLAEILFFPESFLPPAEKRPGMTFHKTVVPRRKMWYNDLTIDRQGQTRF